jgi:hypothetical protein
MLPLRWRNVHDTAGRLVCWICDGTRPVHQLHDTPLQKLRRLRAWPAASGERRRAGHACTPWPPCKAHSSSNAWRARLCRVSPLQAVTPLRGGSAAAERLCCPCVQVRRPGGRASHDSQGSTPSFLGKGLASTRVVQQQICVVGPSSPGPRLHPCRRQRNEEKRWLHRRSPCAPHHALQRGVDARPKTVSSLSGSIQTSRPAPPIVL